MSSFSVFELNASQRAAVLHDAGPAAVYAGPGSGKTRVVALRAIRLAGAGNRLLVTTFTHDATEEMKARILPALPKDGPGAAHITTLHAFCFGALRQQGQRFQLLTDENLRRALAEKVEAADLEGGIANFLNALSYQKNLGFTAATYRPGRSAEDRDFARAWIAYEKEKAKKGLREFDDLILDVAALLATEETLRARIAGNYTHILVDECQDMNAPQYRIVFALGQTHKNVMLVGDPDQSLYGFRGADSQTFRRFAEHPRTQVYELRENYRSARPILTFADALIRQDTERKPRTLIPTRPEGEPVRWERFPDADTEALAVGARILQLRRAGTAFREMAVLYRTNAQSEAFERHFAALEIPFALREEGDFYARKEVRGLLAYLHFFAGASAMLPADTLYPDEWLLALLPTPNRQIARETGGHLRRHAEIRGKRIWDILPEFYAPDLRTHRGLRRLRQELETLDKRLPRIAHAGEAIRAIRAVTGFDDWLRRDEKDDRDNDRLQNVQRMQAAAAHYPTIAEYLEAVQRVRDNAARRKSEQKKRNRQRDEVTLGTGHSAKGLEWPIVFAVGWSEELLPHRKAEDIAEERRIAYVIATRARDRLFVSSPESWNEATVAPSRFLQQLSVVNGQWSEEEKGVPADERLGGLFSTL